MPISDAVPKYWGSSPMVQWTWYIKRNFTSSPPVISRFEDFLDRPNIELQARMIGTFWMVWNKWTVNIICTLLFVIATNHRVSCFDAMGQGKKYPPMVRYWTRVHYSGSGSTSIRMAQEWIPWSTRWHFRSPEMLTITTIKLDIFIL